MSENPIWYLKNCDIFQSIPPEKIDAVAGSTHMEKYPRGHILYSAGDFPEEIYLLKQGEVVLFHEHGGKRRVFETLGSGSLLGGITLKKEKIGHSAEVVSGSKICCFSQKTMLKIIAAHPDAMLHLWQKMGQQLHNYEERLRDRSANAGEILRREIARLTETRQKSFFGLLARPLIITHEELARRTGLNRVTVTKEMKHLRERGVLSVDKKTGAIELL